MQKGGRVFNQRPLQRDFPKLKNFATLSPLPGFASWARKNPAELAAAGLELDVAQLAGGQWQQVRAVARKVNESLTQLAARYLTLAKAGRGDGRQPLDPVARFHLGNGARIERINPLGDASPKGMKQSFGVMVNYLYDLEDLEHNVESFAREGAITTSAAIRRQARKK